jgi:hypothetical protein
MRKIETLMMPLMTICLRMMFRSEAPLQLFCKNCHKDYSREDYWENYIQPLVEHAESITGHPLAYMDKSNELLFATCERCEFQSYWGNDE